MSQESLASVMSTMTITTNLVDPEVVITSSQETVSLLHALPAEAFFECASYLSNVELQSLAMVDRYCREHVLLLQQNDKYAPVYHIERIFYTYMEAYQNEMMLSTIKKTILGVQKVTFVRNAYSDAILWALNYCRSQFNMTETDAVATITRVNDTLFDCLVNATHFTGVIVVNHTCRASRETSTAEVLSSIPNYLPALVLEDISSAESNLIQTRMDALRWNHLRVRIDVPARTMPRFPCLKALDLPNEQVDNEFLRSVFVQQLKSLSVATIPDLDRGLLDEVCLPQLQRLTLYHLYEFEPCDVLPLAPNLEHLSMAFNGDPSPFRMNNISGPLTMRAGNHLRVLDVCHWGSSFETVLRLFRTLPDTLQKFYFTCDCDADAVANDNSVMNHVERPALPASLRVISMVNAGTLALPFSLADATETTPRSLEVSLAFHDACSVNLMEYNLHDCTSLSLYSGQSPFRLADDQFANFKSLRHFAYHAMTNINDHLPLQQCRKAEKLTNPMDIGQFQARQSHIPQLDLQTLPTTLETLHLTNVIVCDGPGEYVERRLNSMRQVDLRHAFKMVNGEVCMFDAQAEAQSAADNVQ